MICFSEKQRCKGIRILESEKFSVMESKSLESGLQLKESGIALAIGIPNPMLHWQNLESNTWNPGPKKKVQTGKSDITGRLFFITCD